MILAIVPSLIPRPLPDLVSHFLHVCEMKSGAGLGPRLISTHFVVKMLCSSEYETITNLVPVLVSRFIPRPFHLRPVQFYHVMHGSDDTHLCIVKLRGRQFCVLYLSSTMPKPHQSIVVVKTSPETNCKQIWR